MGAILEYTPKLLATLILTGFVGVIFTLLGKILWDFIRKDKELKKIDGLTDQITALIISNSEIKTMSKDNQLKISEMHPIIMRLQIKYELLEDEVKSNKVVDIRAPKTL